MNERVVNRFPYVDRRYSLLYACKSYWQFCVLVVLLVLISPSSIYADDIPLKSSEQLEIEANEHYRKKVDRLEAIYESAMNELENDPTKVLKGMSVGEWFYYHIYACYNAVSSVAPFVGAISILLGTVLSFMIRRNKQLLKKVLVWFVFGIPIILLLFVFGVGAII